MHTLYKHKRIFFFVIPTLIITIISILNIFPNGYLISGGDVMQYFNFDKTTQSLSYIWSNLHGEGEFLQFYSYNLFYSPLLYINTLLGLNISNQSIYYFLIFYLLSFWSFYLSLNFYKKKSDSYIKVSLSFLYIFNLITFSYFYYTWGYSPFTYLYILIPLIFSLTYDYFLKTNFSRKSIRYLGILFFFANMPFGNLGYFVSFSILSFIFISSLLFIKKYSISQLVKRIISYYLLFFLSVFFSVIPQMLEMFELSKNVLNTNIPTELGINIKDWILWQSVSLKDSFFLITDINYYINNYSYIAGISVLFIIFSIYFYITKKDKLSFVYLFLLIITLTLINKFRGILSANYLEQLAKNILFMALRTSDKLFIFIPYFLLTIIYLNIDLKKKIHNTFVFILLITNIVLMYPLISGKIQKEYSVTFDKNSNYLNSKTYSYLIKIPKEYFNLSKRTNAYRGDFKFISGPYNKLNFYSGWVWYPKWKLVGSDITFQLFNNSIILMNSPNVVFNWNYGKYWNQQKNIESKWILAFSGLFNSRYLLYHKDVDKSFIKQTKEKIDYYLKNNYLTKIEDNSYFSFYKLNIKYYLPHFYTPNELLFINKSLDNYPDILNNQNYEIRSLLYFVKKNKGKLDNIPDTQLKIENTPVLEFKKINPTKYRVIVHGAKNIFPLVFSESYHDGWKAYINKPDNKILKPSFVQDYGRARQVQDDKLNIQSDKNKALNKYKILDGNEEDQATKEEVQDFINKGYISALGDGKQKTIEHKKWVNNKEQLDYVEKYNIDFISKNFQDTIQNDNLENGNIFETWFTSSDKILKQVQDNKVVVQDDNFNIQKFFSNKNVIEISDDRHLQANGYANSWIINTNEICEEKILKPSSAQGYGMVKQVQDDNLNTQDDIKNKENFCKKNADGSYDFEMIIEFWPQRLFYIGGAISLTTFFSCIVYLIYDKFKKQKNEKNI